MKRFKFIVFLLVIFWLFPLTQKEAKRIAYNWVKLRAFVAKGKIPIKPPSVVEMRFEGVKVGYVAKFKKGFLLIPDSKVLPPIKLSSSNHPFDENNPFIKTVLEELKEVLVKLQERPELAEVFDPFTKKLWSALEQASLGDILFLYREEKKPLVRTTWNQDWPYNYFAPTVDSKRTYAGCVATAFGQILKYWEWPPEGAGSKRYYWSRGGKWLSTSFAHTYNWNNMPNQLTPSSPIDQIKEVARLLYDVGVAVEMEYGTDGSYAYPSEAITTFPKHFKYSPAIKEIYRNSYESSDEWFERFRLEVGALRPFEFTICGKDGCHAVVVDGYRITGSLKQIHINFGWDGWYDGYYTTDNIVTGAYEFKSINTQSAVVNILPPHILSSPAGIRIYKKVDRALAIVSRVDKIEMEESPTDSKYIKAYRIYLKNFETGEVKKIWEGEYSPVINVRVEKFNGRYGYSFSIIGKDGKESVRTPFTSLIKGD